jgi:DNA repair protein RecO (recombination protein O)
VDRIQTPALLARSVDYRDADRICTLLTRAQGKISALARGARSSRRRFGGALSLFVIGDASLRPARRGGELLTLECFDALEDLAPRIASDAVKVGHGSYILELARELWPPAQPEEAAFELVCDALRTLAGSGPDPALLRAYELQLLGAIGLAPALDRCVGCGAAAADPVRVNIARGGILCADCGPGLPLSVAAHAVLLRLQRAPLGRASALAAGDPPAALSPGTVSPMREARDVMQLVLRQVLGKDLRSVEFLAQLAGRGNAG